ncbi:MAG TPA: phosphatase PAP2 family protein [Thermoanaerobaculia bacterium]|nr:phosphatase PAP2 family protein [Thermoanaerobaculia bacterium]
MADRIMAKWRFRDYVPLIVTLVLGALLLGWAGDQFLDLAELVHAKSPLLQKVDTRVHDWAVAKRYSSATSFFDVMTTIGGPVGVATIGGIVLIVLLVRKRFRWAMYVAFTAAGGGALDWELKRYFARARPAVAQMLKHASGYSFPSGHAMGSTVVFGALAYLVLRAPIRWRWKSAAIALASTLVIGVALSRVYLGVHWISDVGAGVTAGLLWLTMTTVAYETFRRIHLVRGIRQEDTASSRRATRGE